MNGRGQAIGHMGHPRHDSFIIPVLTAVSHRHQATHRDGKAWGVVVVMVGGINSKPDKALLTVHVEEADTGKATWISLR